MKWTERLRFVFRKNETDPELDEEIRYHVERQTEQNIAAGMSRREARYAALREFGGVEAIKEECRSSRGLGRLDSLLQDLRYALRNFRRNPTFALTVAGVTALGIGATTAVFSVADRALFRAPAYMQPEQIVSIGIQARILEYDFLTATAYYDLRREAGLLESATSWGGVVNCDLTEGQPVRLNCARVEPSFLPLFGVQPVLGRNLTPEEDREGAPPVAMLSYSLWKGRFAGQADIVGRRVPIDGNQHLIIGVLPEDFELPTLEKVEFLIPRALPANVRQGMYPSRVYGRMKPGVTIAQLEASLAGFGEKLINEAPPQYRKEIRLRVRSLRDLQVGDVRAVYWSLLGAVAAVLLIACANVANLLLVRSIARQRELSIRVALGAGRARIGRQTLTETLLLSLAGGAGGCVLALVLLRAFQMIAPEGIAHLASATIDGRVLLFAVGISVMCGLVFGIAPAMQTPRPESLTGTRTTASSQFLTRHILVGAQLAISLVLLTSAGLLLHSLWQRLSVSLGLRGDNVVTAHISAGLRYAKPASRLALYEQLEQRLQRLPGVEAVALSDSLPPGGVPRTQPFFALQVEGQPPFTQGTGGLVVWRHITPGYFKALGIPILRGRGFTEEDRTPSELSMILSQSYAKKIFPHQDPLGKRICRFGGGPWYTIVGIAADVRNSGLTDSNEPEYYLVRRHTPDDAMLTSSVIVRSAAKPAVIESWIRAELASVDASIPPVFRTFDEHVGELAARPRFQAVLLLLFAAIGLLLAASGLYGLIAYLVAQREREVGVRLALGATPAQIARMILRHALRWTSAGLVVGLAGSAIAAWSLRSLLFHVSTADPAAFAGAVLVLVALALLAALLPSRRAARLDPMTTLRQE